MEITRLRKSARPKTSHNKILPYAVDICQPKIGANRVTWQNKGGKSFVWRCRERLKNGTTQCKQSVTVKESVMLKLLSELFTSILKTDLAEASVYLIKTKAILNVNLIDKKDYEVDDITKPILNKAIDRIVIVNEKTATVHFKSGLIMKKDFIETIE